MNRPLAKVLGPVCLLAAMPLVAQPPRIVQSPVGDSALALVESGWETRLEDRLGSRGALPVPSGARLSALAELADGWVAAGDKATGELVLLVEAEGEVAPLAGPGGRFGFRRQPIPLVAAGRLVGLAWLEGDGGENNGVWTARRAGDGWEAPRAVAPWTGEAQLGLAATVLDDGSWLVVWNAVDGEDDEILWSRVRDGEAGEPARLHAENRVPDILPAVAAVPGGAVVAWSRLDAGVYRLRLARFDGAAWSGERVVGGDGAVAPTVVPGERGPAFLFSTVRPSEWSLIEVDDRGRVARRLAIEPHSSRPLVLAADAEGVELRLSPVADRAGLVPAPAAAAAEERRVRWEDGR